MSITPLEEEGANPIASWQFHFVNGIKNGQYVRLASMTVDDPMDANKKSLRVLVGKSIDINDINKRAIAVHIENNVKQLYLRTHWAVQMPATKAHLGDLIKVTY